MNRSQTDAKAITASTLYLEMRGYTIFEQNWHRSKQKIDIVAKKDETIYFVKVEYRSDAINSLTTIDVVTETKVKQLLDAAERWVSEEKWGGNYELSAIEVGDPNFAIISFSDSLLY